MKTRKFSFLDFYNILLIIYLLLPIIMIIVFSFSNNPSGQFPMKGLTLDWYRKAFSDKLIINAIKNSIYVALSTAGISVIIGTLASFALTRYQFKFKKIVNTFMLIPITLPGIILGIALLSFFSNLHFAKSLLTVIISHVLFTVPFVVLIMNARLEGFDTAIEEASKDLGANTTQTFRYITFPIIRPSIIGVIMLTFALSFDEFLVTFFTVGRQNTLPLIIWSMLRRGVSPKVNAVATVVLCLSFSLILIANKYAKLKLKV